MSGDGNWNFGYFCGIFWTSQSIKLSVYLSRFTKRTGVTFTVAHHK